MLQKQKAIRPARIHASENMRFHSAKAKSKALLSTVEMSLGEDLYSFLLFWGLASPSSPEFTLVGVEEDGS